MTCYAESPQFPVEIVSGRSLPDRVSINPFRPSPLFLKISKPTIFDLPEPILFIPHEIIHTLYCLNSAYMSQHTPAIF